VATVNDCGAECSNWQIDDWKIKGLCGHRGRMVGRFFVVVDGRVLVQPRGTRLPPRGQFGSTDLRPVWDVVEPIYNLQNLWTCSEGCEDCRNFPSPFAPYDGCVGVGSSLPVTRAGGGECYGNV
jgi:hypothetical protein